MTFLLSSCVLWISTCISFLSADSVISVSAQLNSTVLLPCQFKRDLSQTPHIEWYIGFETVFERRGKNVYQSEGYKDRVDVPEDELLKGNCSLVLKNVRATDANIYKSYMVVKHTAGSDKRDFVQNVELRIDESPMPDKETSEETQSGTKTPKSDKETSKESSPGTNDAGMNSTITAIIISSVIACVSIAVLTIIATMLYRRRNINKSSD